MSAKSSIVRTRAASSAGCLAFRAQTPPPKPAIWASVASPPRIVAMACPARSAGSSSCRSRRPSTSGHSAAVIAGCYRGESVRKAAQVPCARSERAGNSGGLAALAHETSTLTFVETAPHALLLAGSDRVLETRLAHRAHRADRLGGVAGAVGFRGRIEELRVCAETTGVLTPMLGHGWCFLVSGGSGGRARETFSTNTASAPIPFVLSSSSDVFTPFPRNRTGQPRFVDWRG